MNQYEIGKQRESFAPYSRFVLVDGDCAHSAASAAAALSAVTAAPAAAAEPAVMAKSLYILQIRPSI